MIKYRVTKGNGHEEYATEEAAQATGLPFEVIEEIIPDLSYQDKRRQAYKDAFGATWEETLDYIYKNGLPAYCNEKAAIKMAIPKGE